MKTEISVIVRLQMKAALAEDLDFIKGEFQAVRAEVVNSIMTLRAEIDKVRLSVKKVLDRFSNWSDKTEVLRGTVMELEKEVDEHHHSGGPPSSTAANNLINCTCLQTCTSCSI